jgi:hypothetical protein
VAFPYTLGLTYSEGKWSSFRLIFDRAELMTQLGLMPLRRAARYGRSSARSSICWTSQSRPSRTPSPRRPTARRLRTAPARRRRDHLVHRHRARGPGSHQRAAREP